MPHHAGTTSIITTIIIIPSLDWYYIQNCNVYGTLYVSPRGVAWDGVRCVDGKQLGMGRDGTSVLPPVQPAPICSRSRFPRPSHTLPFHTPGLPHIGLPFNAVHPSILLHHLTLVVSTVPLSARFVLPFYYLGIFHNMLETPEMKYPPLGLRALRHGLRTYRPPAIQRTVLRTVVTLLSLGQ